MKFIHENNRIYGLNENSHIVAEIIFPLVGQRTVDINHTFVDTSLRGQGIADKLVRAAVEDLKASDLKVIASCPYAAKWFSDHHEFSDLLDV